MRTGTRFGLIIGTGIALTSLIGCSNETTATRNQSADSVAVADSSKKYSFADIPFVKDEIKADTCFLPDLFNYTFTKEIDTTRYQDEITGEYITLNDPNKDAAENFKDSLRVAFNRRKRNNRQGQISVENAERIYGEDTEISTPEMDRVGDEQMRIDNSVQNLAMNFLRQFPNLQGSYRLERFKWENRNEDNLVIYGANEFCQYQLIVERIFRDYRPSFNRIILGLGLPNSNEYVTTCFYRYGNEIPEEIGRNFPELRERVDLVD
ncbi:hypothetical protein J4405_00585 [Candidatus Woesearchaeota archaeon]|nr:hypothetical protein [Candidatus Woesearchaeota archaeon]